MDFRHCPLTHLQILIEQPQFSHWLELVVLLPARDHLLRPNPGAVAGNHILHPPTEGGREQRSVSVC